jgi:hypothetical protein
VQQAADDLADERTFVHVGVDDVWSLAQARKEHCPEKEQVKGNLVGRGTHFVSLAEGNGRSAPDIEARAILPIPVGAYGELVTLSLEHSCLFQDPNRAAIVGKE